MISYWNFRLALQFKTACRLPTVSKYNSGQLKNYLTVEHSNTAMPLIFWCLFPHLYNKVLENDF